MKKKNNVHPLDDYLKKPWENNDNNVCIASTVSLERNIEKFKFPGKLETERRKQIITILEKEILAVEGLTNPRLFKAEELDHLDKEYLVEHFLSSQGLHQASSGEAFVIDESGLFLATLNLDNHLHLQLLDVKADLEGSWNKLVKIETAIGKAVTYAFSPKFGFLTADPSQCGTALQITVFLQLPALVHTGKINTVLDKQLDEGIAVTGIQGNPSEIIGDVLAIKNNYTLGLTEENIMGSLRSFMMKLQVEENSCRQQIRHSESADIKDKVSRAFGILIHSYQIEAIEALNAISLIKLGTDMGWLKGVTMTTLNQLFFKCRRAHLLCQLNEKVPQEEIIHKRAAFIHEILKDAHLVI